MLRYRGAGGKLKVEGHDFRRFAIRAGKFFFCAPHFSAVPLQFGGGHYAQQGGTKMWCSYSSLQHSSKPFRRQCC